MAKKLFTAKELSDIGARQQFVDDLKKFHAKGGRGSLDLRPVRVAEGILPDGGRTAILVFGRGGRPIRDPNAPAFFRTFDPITNKLGWTRIGDVSSFNVLSSPARIRSASTKIKAGKFDFGGLFYVNIDVTNIEKTMKFMYAFAKAMEDGDFLKNAAEDMAKSVRQDLDIALAESGMKRKYVAHVFKWDDINNTYGPVFKGGQSITRSGAFSSGKFTPRSNALYGLRYTKSKGSARINLTLKKNDRLAPIPPLIKKRSFYKLRHRFADQAKNLETYANIKSSIKHPSKNRATQATYKKGSRTNKNPSWIVFVYNGKSIALTQKLVRTNPFKGRLAHFMQIYTSEALGQERMSRALNIPQNDVKEMMKASGLHKRSPYASSMPERGTSARQLRGPSGKQFLGAMFYSHGRVWRPSEMAKSRETGRTKNISSGLKATLRRSMAREFEKDLVLTLPTANNVSKFVDADIYHKNDNATSGIIDAVSRKTIRNSPMRMARAKEMARQDSILTSNKKKYASLGDAGKTNWLNFGKGANLSGNSKEQMAALQKNISGKTDKYAMVTSAGEIVIIE